MVFCNLFKDIFNYRIKVCHNPYFNRWFSAIKTEKKIKIIDITVTILILIDGFLQYQLIGTEVIDDNFVTILILIDGFLQFHIDLLKEL